MLGHFYSETPSWLHRLPVGVKLLGLAVLGPGVLAAQTPWQWGTVWLGVCIFWYTLGAATQPVRRLLRAVWLGAALVAVLHAVLGQPLLGLASMARLVSAGMLALAVSVSTSTSALLDWFEWRFTPLERVGLQPRYWSLQVALMLRFIELFFVQWQRLDEAFRLRTGRSGGWRLLAPLTILMLLAARRVADTLQLRIGGGGR